MINSPTLTSTKWWIGMSGQTATHTVCLAQLIIKNENKGLFWFVVPLRDRKTGKLLPRVSAGDIGPKVSRNGLDNGWIQFNDVRVPRKAMLSRWAIVERDGTFTPPKDMAISYSTLIGERIYAALGCYTNLAKAAIIASRYMVNRKQGPNDKSVLDYQIQLQRLVPALCGSIVIKVTGDIVMEEWQQVLKLSQNKETMKEFLIKSKDFHCKKIIFVCLFYFILFDKKLFHLPSKLGLDIIRLKDSKIVEEQWEDMHILLTTQ